MAWFKREKKPIENPTPIAERRVVTEGMWIKCDSCRAIIWKKDLEANWEVCPKCEHHFRLDADLASSDPLVFTDTRPYAQRLKDAQRKLGMKDAIITAEGHLNGRSVICCSMEFRFIGGSMGAVVGEKVARAIERCIEKREPLIVVSCSGGARMMEGTVSLMQLAKVAAALARLDDAKLPFLSPVRASSSKPSVRNSPKVFKPPNFCSSTASSTPSFRARNSSPTSAGPSISSSASHDARSDALMNY